MELRSEPAYTETPMTDWEFATTGGTRAFTLEDGVDSCEYFSDLSEFYRQGERVGMGGFVVTEVKTDEVTVILLGPGLIGYTRRHRIKKTPVKPFSRKETTI